MPSLKFYPTITVIPTLWAIDAILLWPFGRSSGEWSVVHLRATAISRFMRDERISRGIWWGGIYSIIGAVQFGSRSA